MEYQPDSMIIIEGVEKRFGETTALKDLSFSVKTGEVFGFLGPSGAGKTTTIKLLTRQLTPNAGVIRLFGEELSKLPQSMFDRVGILSDNSGIYERLNVYDNLLVFAELKRIERSMIHECLERVGLAGEEKKPAKALSRGMKQRLMLAQAILHRPELLFLDEPTAALDPGTAKQIHDLLRSLNDQGTTVFLTTHNMEEADKLCSCVAFLNLGKIIACDTPDALKLHFAKNEVVVRTAAGHIHQVEKTGEGLKQILEKLERDNDSFVTVHSQEPNLEQIFLQLTGRGLS